MRVAWGVGITTGWGETEVFMEVSSRRLAIVQHRHPPARGLLSLISLLSAFLLTGIKRNQAEPHHAARDARKHQRRRPLAIHGSAPGTDTGSGVRQSDNT